MKTYFTKSQYIARLLWIFLAMSAISIYLFAVPTFYQDVASLNQPSFGFTEGWTTESFQKALDDLGISSQQLAIFFTLIYSSFTIVCCLVGLLIFIRKSDEPILWFKSLLMFLFGIFFTPIPEALDTVLLEPWRTVLSIYALTPFICFFLLFYIFPDGRFVPNWTVWLVPLWIVINIGASYFPDTWFDINHYPVYVQLPQYIGMFFSFIYAQFYRYKYVSNEKARQQTKLVVRGLVIALLVFFTAGFTGRMVPALQHNDSATLIYEISANVLVLFCVGFVPLSIGFAVLRNNLWGIEPVVNRTLVYFGLTASVILIYATTIGYLSLFIQVRNNLLASLIATGTVAVLFQPLRDRMQRSVNRLMYGERDDPYFVLVGLGHRLESVLTLDKVLPIIVETIADSLKIPQVSLWLVEDESLKLGAIHGNELKRISLIDPGTILTFKRCTKEARSLEPDSASPFGQFLAKENIAVVLPVLHRGEMVGVLCLSSRSPGESFTPADLHLLRDLAGGAGAAVQAAQLTLTLQERLSELRQSHERLLNAQEEERRRIQRDLHDGLGPVLASMRFRLETCLDQAASYAPDLSKELNLLYGMIGDATSEIRHLVYDLRPPVLDQLGLVGALRQRIERFTRETGIDLELKLEENFDLTAAEEAAIFKIVHEGLVNIQKHAHANRTLVKLYLEKDEAILLLKDDGVGFDMYQSKTQIGAGIRSMRERAELLGGKLYLCSEAGTGTEIEVRIPLERFLESNNGRKNN